MKKAVLALVALVVLAIVSGPPTHNTPTTPKVYLASVVTTEEQAAEDVLFQMELAARLGFTNDEFVSAMVAELSGPGAPKRLYAQGLRKLLLLLDGTMPPEKEKRFELASREYEAAQADFIYVYRNASMFGEDGDLREPPLDSSDVPAAAEDFSRRNKELIAHHGVDESEFRIFLLLKGHRTGNPQEKRWAPNIQRILKALDG